MQLVPLSEFSNGEKLGLRSEVKYLTSSRRYSVAILVHVHFDPVVMYCFQKHNVNVQ